MKEKIEAMKERMEKLMGIKKTMDSEKRVKVSLTDPEARLMKTRNCMDVCFNSQISVDQENHLTVDYDLNNDTTDYVSLLPLTESTRRFKGSDKIESLSGRGYFFMGNVKSMADDSIDAYIPEARHGMHDKLTDIPKSEFHESKFLYNSGKNIYMCPENKEMHYLRNKKTVKGLKYWIYATAACESSHVRTDCTESRRGSWI